MRLIETSKEARRERTDHAAGKGSVYLALMCLAAVAITVMVNLVVGQLPRSVTRFDLSEQKMFTLSEQTESILDALEEDVEIHIVAESGEEDLRLETMLSQYSSRSKHIRVDTIDPVLVPLSRYSVESLTNNSLIVESARRFQIVDYSDIYEFSTNWNTQTNAYDYEISFRGEPAVTSAIEFVCGEQLPVVYVLSGHGEYLLPETFRQAIEKQNIELRDLSILSSAQIPADCACLLIAAPVNDLSPRETEAILSYLGEGGNLLLTRDYVDVSYPNLDSLMDAYGMYLENGIVVETDPQHYYQPYGVYLLPEIMPHEVTAPLISNKSNLMVAYGQGIGVLPSYRSSLSILPLLRTSEQAFLSIPDSQTGALDLENTDGSPRSSHVLAMAVQERYGETKTRVVVLGSSYIADESANEITSGGNEDFILNVLGWLCEKGSSISIHAKSIQYDSLVISGAAGVWWSALFAGIIPGAVLLFGFVVWNRRRKN